VPEPSDLWEEELNTKTSEIVYSNAIVDPSVASIVDYRKVDKWKNNTAFQFERMGYFVVDLDTTELDGSKDGGSATGKPLLVFNRTVNLKEEVFKQKRSKQEEDINAARKAKQAADLAAKEVRMTIDPIDLFRVGEEYQGKYSQYDDKTGLPTHAADATELTKSAIKKLAKEQQKHVNALAKWKKASK
jgi:predicted extracellular nuclease